MTTLSIALDSPRQRDITLYAGDDASIDVVVYAKDGDRTPLTTVTDVAVTYAPGPSGQNSLNVAGFSADFYYRTRYTMTANVAGKRTTLAHGLLISPDFIDPVCGFCDYGWWVWGVQPAINAPNPLIDGGDAQAVDDLEVDGGSA